MDAFAQAALADPAALGFGFGWLLGAGMADAARLGPVRRAAAARLRLRDGIGSVDAPRPNAGGSEIPAAAILAVSPSARDLVARVSERFGRLLFHRFRDDGPATRLICYAADEFRPGAGDVLFAELAGFPFYVEAGPGGLPPPRHLLIDTVPCRPSGLSLEAGWGRRFAILRCRQDG